MAEPLTLGGMNSVERGVLALVLVGAVFGLCVHYDGATDRWSSPSVEEIDGEYDRHVGETVLLFGIVENVDRNADTATVRVEHDGGEFEMVLTEFDADTEPGNIVQAYGTLEPDRRMTVRETVVVTESSGAERYKFGVSVLGAALILLLFFRHWRIDLDSLAFEVRDDA